MYLIKFLILISVCYSVAFSSANSIGTSINVLEEQMLQSRLTISLTEVNGEDWTFISIAVDAPGLPRTQSGILACLISDDKEIVARVAEAKAFIDGAYALKEECKKKIENKKHEIKSIARKTLNNYFIWGSISTSDKRYDWHHASALELIDKDLGYLNVALEIKSRLDDGLLEDEYLKKGVDRTKLRSDLEEAIPNCIKLLEDIKQLEQTLDAISKPMASPKHKDFNSADYDF